MLTGGADGSIRAHDPVGLAHRFSLEGHTAGVRALAAASPGRVVSGSEDGQMLIWNLKAKICEGRLAGHSSVVWTMIIAQCRPGVGSGGGGGGAPARAPRVISAGGDGVVAVWDVWNGR